MNEIGDADFLRLVRFVRDNYGINLEQKRTLINARLSFFISQSKYCGFGDFVEFVLTHPQSEECRQMMNRLSTNYTYFFRETNFIDQLEKTVLPQFASRGKNRLRIWCSACSSGQEAYTLAMVLEHDKLLGGYPQDYEIVCTDINTQLLEQARNAEYPEEQLKEIPQPYRQYVTPHPHGTFRISESICSKIEWKYENLLDTVNEPCGYDIIFCRNVMIYFQSELRVRIVKKLYDSVADDGYLFCGATESIDLERRYFQYLAPSFYRKHHNKEHE